MRYSFSSGQQCYFKYSLKNVSMRKLSTKERKFWGKKSGAPSERHRLTLSLRLF